MERFTWVYKDIEGFTEVIQGYTGGLHFTRDYSDRGIQENTKEYKRIQGNTGEYKRIQGNIGKYKRIQKNTLGNTRKYKGMH